MQDLVRDRVIRVGECIASTGRTIREVAEEFGCSKTTIHNDCRIRLKDVDSVLYNRVSAILLRNLSERSIRGGQATKRRFLSARKDS